MKPGDLVKPKQKYANNEVEIGVLLEVEKVFYRRNTHTDYFQDRLTIYWLHGEITREPASYVEVIK
jgi:hypothetical protein